MASTVAKETWRWFTFTVGALAASTLLTSMLEPERRWIFWLGVGLMWAAQLADVFYRRAVHRYWDQVEQERKVQR